MGLGMEDVDKEQGKCCFWEYSIYTHVGLERFSLLSTFVKVSSTKD